MQHIILENGLNDIAVIRTTFETLDLLPPDDPILLELSEMIAVAQQNLIQEYEAVCDAIRANPSALQFPLREFQIEMIQAITKGWDRNTLNRFTKFKAFDEGESSLYYFEMAGLVDIETAREMPPHEFVLWIFREMLHQMRKTENYANKQTFDKEVFQRYFFLLFVSYILQNKPR